MEEALQKITNTNFDDNLKEVQNGSMATMEMMSKTFCGILMAFQQQANKDKEIEDKLSTICTKISNIESNLKETQQSIQNTVNDIDKKFVQQSNDTNTKLQNMQNNVEKITSDLKNDCQQTLDEVTNKLQASSQNVQNVEKELNKYSIKLQSMNEKVESSLHSMSEKQQNIESQMMETTNTLNDKLNDMEYTINENKENMQQQIKDVSDQFQNLRFEVDRIASTKADIADLKRKTNTKDFDKLTKDFSKVTLSFTNNMEQIKNEMVTNHDRFDENISSNQQKTETKHSAFDKEIGQINNTLGEIQYKMNQNEKKSQQNVDNDMMMPMIQELQTEVDLIVKELKKNQPSTMGATSSGSCFSCGQKVNSFPALPARNRSPDKRNIGGGFTFDRDASRMSAKFNSNMRSELAQIARDISKSPSKRMSMPHIHKSPSKQKIERKPMKLPALGKSNTTSQL